MSRRTEDMYYKVPRELTNENDRLSDCEMVIYLWLCELEQRFTDNYVRHGGRDWFMCTDTELAKLTGKNKKTVQKAKALLRDKGYIQTWVGGWHYSDTGKSGIRQPTCYRILR